MAKLWCPSHATRRAGCTASTASIASTAMRMTKFGPNTIDPLRTLLNRIAIPGFDADSYISNHQNNVSALPNTAIAFSGGGYRAMLNGAGVLAAFDDRTPNATAKGQLGGLLQASTYVAGLSGGNWLVGSIYANNFTSVQEIIDAHGQTWDISNSILQGPPQTLPGILGTGQYYSDLVDQVNQKRDAPGDFNASITDYWGRALSYQLINGPDGGLSYTWSSLQLQDFITDATAPLPIVIADGRAPGEKLISGNTTIYEFTPWEMGTWDPTVYGFAPLEYVGSNFSAGAVVQDQQCVRGFDNAGFVMGTSSSLFNQFILQINTTATPDVPEFIRDAIGDLLEGLSEDDNDIADWTPNPFYGFNNATNLNANSRRLTLVDGGEDLQNIPLHPLIQPIRQVDTIFAVDTSADTEFSWPNGTSMVATYERSLDDIANGTSFPSVPDVNTFVNLGLNSKPTFFGCEAGNFSGAATTPPLVVYLPNSFYSFSSNISTFTLSYSTAERNAMIENGFNGATQGNSSIDANWPVCVGCAMLSRSFGRTGTPVPDACTTCFKQYCWDGTTNNTQPLSFVPQPKLTVTSAATSLAPASALLVSAVGIASIMLLL
ncbi:hypothetical protein FH972_023300 [Carpinus fangiana]|uniref:lysophospholipase n=1 Tax=Carpinus fangiana TaxID=176857 RepID=A0A5N6KX29_9ROSI|nr:hypothetical protein FH972_023300 [Carpinus fangiana]